MLAWITESTWPHHDKPLILVRNARRVLSALDFMCANYIWDTSTGAITLMTISDHEVVFPLALVPSPVALSCSGNSYSDLIGQFALWRWLTPKLF
jgi:hypothetical protein